MMKYLRSSIIVVIVAIATSLSFESNAQGGCFEIKSILVDACGSPEGENEMTRFDIGPAPLNVANMTVTWPNNAFQGLCQNPNTAAIVAAVNQNIVGCGLLSEPVGGVLPANSKILLLTSTNINTIANSFVNLNDTVIVLFQCSNNTSGHFANYNLLPGLRTLSIQFSGAGGCTDSVTYDRTLLVNQFGVVGGFSFENDGAFVEFTSGGAATYLNHGCQVLSTGLSLTGGPDIGICPGSNPVANLTGTAINMIGNPQWSGGTGSFSAPNSLSTTYTPGTGETGLVLLTVTANGPCNAVKTDTVRVNIVPSLPSVNITSSVSGTFFSNITDPTYFYNWYPDGSTTAIQGAFNSTFSPNTNGCYYMILSTIGGCTVQSNTLCITNVGLQDINSGTFMSVISNPGSSPSIRIETLKPSGNIEMQIVDIYGRIVKQAEINNSNKQFEVSPDWTDISSGIYFIRISSGEWIVEGKVALTK